MPKYGEDSKGKRKDLRLRKKHKGEREGCCERGSKREEEEEEKALKEESMPDN